MRLAPGAAVLAVVGVFISGSQAGAARDAAARALGPSPRLLVRASVSDRARNVMPPALWKRYAGAYAGMASRSLPDDASPDADGCRTAGGDYLVDAAFDLRDDLPGLANASDRFAGRVRLVVTACADARNLIDRTIRLDGEPVPAAVAGTPEALESAWHDAVPAAFARGGVALGRVAHAERLEAGGGLFRIAFTIGAAPAGTIVSDVITATHAARRPPLHLTITRAGEASDDAIFATGVEGGPAPSAGDVIEYVPPDAANATPR